MLSQERKANRLRNVFYISLIFLISALPKLKLSLLGNMSADASVYLDIARNLISGKGLTISCNIYQYWKDGVYYPALIYMQFLFSILIAPVFFIFKTAESVNVFNVMISAVNTVLMYRLLIGWNKFSIAFWSAVLIGTSSQMLYTSMFPWTEQVHLLFLLLSLSFIVSGLQEQNNKKIILAGMLMGANCLIRAANFYAILSFAASTLLLKRPIRESLKKAALFVAAVTLFLACYQAFCFLKYGRFYPEYLKSAMSFRLGELLPGAYYEASRPVLRISELSEADKLRLFAENFFPHIVDFINKLGLISFFIVPIGVLTFYRRRIEEVFLFVLGISTILCYSLSLY
jgi:hypothetical protein